MTDQSAPTRGGVTQGDHLLKATWFRFCPSTGEYTGEYCSVRPHDDSNMVPMLNPSAVMEVAVAARLAAIEDCAKACDRIAAVADGAENIGAQAGAMLAAKAIRNLGRGE